eukprot:TRINITY_DN2127_c0_g1_i2.p1 TRINITY_DN2127_c0_g1~~TRINITY_DN2127_c0_g1_i2.p1  ORF type:complete len:262 (+),score=86.36 TRINITY_DN2127_c0_g1_i2:304-1089(+)
MYGLRRQPDYPAAIAQIGSLSSEELMAYMEEEGGDKKLEELVKSLHQVKELYREKEMLLASNKSLADYNMSQKPVLEKQTESLQGTKDEAIALAQKIKALRSEIDQQSQRVQPDVLLSLLEAAYAEAEEFSETIADSFLEGNESNLEEFLEKFQEARKLSHCRRVKVDKLKEIIAKESSKASTTSSPFSLSSQPSSKHPSAGGNAAPPPPSSLPYPSPYPGISMPMPFAESLAPQLPSLNLPYPLQPPTGYPYMPSYPPMP